MTAEEWGIPTLDLAMQAERLVAPVTKWGTRRRDEPMPGTWHLFTDDYRFTHLWNAPQILPATGCVVTVEANFSTWEAMPRAEALHRIFRKRVLARMWQQEGVRIIVDLNVEPGFRDIALLGVPEGWNAYATRAHRGVPFSVIEEDFALAVHHSGRPDPFFVVFGGGYASTKPECLKRGWQWVPEHRQVVEGKVAAYGQG